MSREDENKPKGEKDTAIQFGPSLSRTTLSFEQGVCKDYCWDSWRSY